jgi:hypothetical protein
VLARNFPSLSPVALLRPNQLRDVSGISHYELYTTLGNALFPLKSDAQPLRAIGIGPDTFAIMIIKPAKTTFARRAPGIVS